MKIKRLFVSLIFCFVLQSLIAQEWYVCLASFKNQDNAKNYTAVLGQYELPSWIFFSSTPKGDFYRVLYDLPSQTIEQARKLRDELAATKGAKTLKLQGLWVCVAEKEIVPLVTKNDSIVQEALVPPAAEKLPEPVVLTVNEEKQNITSEEKPYSVHIKSYKEESPAVRDKERLNEKNIDAYVLKSYDEDTYFSFDLHAGAFENEEDTEPLLDQLEELGIEGAEVSNYSDIKDSIEQYNEIVDSTTVSASQGNFEIPDSFSESVQTIIAEYPINPDFQLEKLEIYDVDNIRKNYGSTSSFETVDNLFIYQDLSTNINAVSYAVYNDSLFDKQFDYIIATGPQACFDDMKEKMESNSSAASIPLNVKGQVYDSWYTLNDEGFLKLQGFSKNCDSLVMLLSSDFTEDEVAAFLNDFSNDSSILVYPQIRKNLLTLPKKNPHIERDFIQFKLSQVDESYAEKKGYANWAIPIVGHWCAENYYFQNDKKITTSFFDLDYDYNANKIHQMFMNKHYEDDLTDDNHPCDVKDRDGWYVYSYDLFGSSNEVSFTNGVYIIAVNSYSGGFFTEEELISFAEELQIWDSDAK